MYGPDNNLPMQKEQVDEARALCEDCPVRRDCLVFSLVMEDNWGVWGGFTPAERRRSLNLVRRKSSDSIVLLVPRVLRHYDAGNLERQVILL